MLEEDDDDEVLAVAEEEVPLVTVAGKYTFASGLYRVPPIVPPCMKLYDCPLVRKFDISKAAAYVCGSSIAMTSLTPIEDDELVKLFL